MEEDGGNVMIAMLRGEIISQEENIVLLDVNGVGYQLLLSGAALDMVRTTQGQVCFYTYLQLKDDGASLYGFNSSDEKWLFQKIITVSGVGPKLAQGILLIMNYQQFISAIQQGDRLALTKIPGIGKKIADRLILELSDVLGKVELSGWELDEEMPLPKNNMLQDALSALEALGYSTKEAEEMVRQAVATLGDTEDLQVVLKAALSLASKGGH